MKAETQTLRCLMRAPSYKLTGHDGKLHAQHHYTGHTHVILYFLASVANPRCRAYCQELSEKHKLAGAYKTAILGIAPEPVEDLARAQGELGLAFPLLYDPARQLAERYGLITGKWVWRRAHPSVFIHDKYGILYYVAVPEDPDERPAWAELEEVLKRFPRG
jgi:peroxiredoxin